MCNSKAKNPLVRQQMERVTIKFRDKRKKELTIYLFKRAIGEPCLSALGYPLQHWCFSNSISAKIIRYLNGVKEFTRYNVPVTVSEYYSHMFSEIEKELENDKYWNYKGNTCTKQMYKRVGEILQELCLEDIDVDVPELVTYFYNFAKPN